MIDPQLLRILIALVGILAFVALNALALVYAERKIAGHVQRRPGPYEVGPHGIIQPLVDGLKLMGKQLTTPRDADPVIFWLAPILCFMPVALCIFPIPFGPDLIALDLNLGMVLILAFAGLGVLSLCLAGWGSNNKWSLLGAARAVSQNVAYEIPLLLAVLSVAFMTGSLNLATISAGQGAMPWQWNVLLNPLGFIIYFICALAETNRAPFDLPEAESELTAGFHTEYSGMGFGLFFMAEYANMIVVCAVATVLFLGGWNGPFAPGWWWFLLKMYLLIFLIIQIRWTYPRVRFDQLLNLCWRWLVPLALLNLVYVTIIVKL
ncbi:NADH-quinone oxidoreductase subunit NuoH [Desulfovibrionales bacterium]